MTPPTPSIPLFQLSISWPMKFTEEIMESSPRVSEFMAAIRVPVVSTKSPLSSMGVVELFQVMKAAFKDKNEPKKPLAPTILTFGCNIFLSC